MKKHEAIKYYKCSDAPEIVFQGDFDGCIDYCEKKYKDSVLNFPSDLIWGDSETTCEIFEYFDDDPYYIQK